MSSSYYRVGEAFVTSTNLASTSPKKQNVKRHHFRLQDGKVQLASEQLLQFLGCLVSYRLSSWHRMRTSSPKMVSMPIYLFASSSS